MNVDVGMWQKGLLESALPPGLNGVKKGDDGIGYVVQKTHFIFLEQCE